MNRAVSSSPRISVCLTHYNRPGKLDATLASLACQTRMPDEIFLRDDCSPNDPEAVVRKWQTAFPHFVYVRNPRNLNMPGNLNAVVSQATGDLIANLHDADEFDPRLIELWGDALIRHPSAGMVYCGLESPQPGNAPPRFWLNAEIPPLSNGVEFFEKHFLRKWSSLIWGTTMVRKSVYEEMLPFRAEFRNWADVDMWMRIALNYDMAYVDLPLIKTDEGETDLRAFDWGKVFIQHRMMENAIRMYCKKTGRSVRGQLLLQRFNLLQRWGRHMASGLGNRDGERLKMGAGHFFSVLFNTVAPRPQ